MASKNILGIVEQVRRITNKSSTSTDSDFMSEADISVYLDDAARDIRILYPDFDEFVVTGTNISPVPDRIDERVLALGAACLILLDEDVRSSGDAILIKAGSITLDTSKSVRGLSDSAQRICNTFHNMIDTLNVDGKAGVGFSGTRVDNYKRVDSDTKDSGSLI